MDESRWITAYRLLSCEAGYYFPYFLIYYRRPVLLTILIAILRIRLYVLDVVLS